MSSDHEELSLLLVSANVGTLFEQPERLLEPWLNTFCAKVSQDQPDFVALHCQEVGGKSYMTGMEYVDSFVERLLTSSDLVEYSRVRGYIDKDYETKTEFTALGSVYLVHSRVSDAAMWDFSGCRFHPVADKEIKHDNLNKDPYHRKLKYPPDFFPQFPWSRKGHIITRWRLRNRVVDIVNVHLFHDASNLESVSQSPSIYVANRARALRHTLKRIEELGLREAPMFIFGDFNFRIDLHGIVHDHLAGVNAKSTEKDGVVACIEYCHADCSDDDTPALKLEKKGFVLKKGIAPSCSQLIEEWRKFDKESKQFPDLFEQEITFPPSYPFSEDEGVTDQYMHSRPPSWCDRVLYNQACKDLLQQSSSTADYGVIGASEEMGDHKPVCLSVGLPACAAAAVSNNSHGNNIGNSHAQQACDNGDSASGEPAAKRVSQQLRCDHTSAGGLLVTCRHMLILAMLYCLTLILIQFTTGVDPITAIVIVLLLAATVLHFVDHR
ncbi:inositol polyphosphate-5-phosphatase A-like isoform X2 [Sycon ciliatum]|uniref:inositol polyphosphate-5-phosphatase A-like isoform X2 n=1 Tax=Sycon ciliatum TaxID=27933 RepID=UPI0031F6A57F